MTYITREKKPPTDQTQPPKFLRRREAHEQLGLVSECWVGLPRRELKRGTVAWNGSQVNNMRLLPVFLLVSTFLGLPRRSQVFQERYLPDARDRSLPLIKAGRLAH
jgi:hypothetical protein